MSEKEISNAQHEAKTPVNSAPETKTSREAELWRALRTKSSSLEKPSARRFNQEKVVLDMLWKYHRDLYLGVENATLSREESDKLVERIRGKDSEHTLKHRMNFLVKGLEKGAETLGWQVSIPSIPRVVAREPARFTPDNFAGLERIRQFEKIFIESLAGDPPPSRGARLGQLLVSAILFGGLLHQRWLEPWLNAAKTFRTNMAALWLEMKWTCIEKRYDEGEAKPRFKERKTYCERPDWTIRRRWVADPLTALLLLHWKREFPGDSKSGRNGRVKDAAHYDSESGRHDRVNDAAHYLKLFLAHLPQNETVHHYREIGKLMGDATTRTSLLLPPFLASYATCKLKAVSLPETAWTRIWSERSVEVTKEPSDKPGEVVTPPPDTLPPARTTFIMTEQQQLLRSMLTLIYSRKAAKKKTAAAARKELLAFLYANDDRLMPVLKLCGAWGVDLLTHYPTKELLVHRSKLVLKPSTTKGYLQAIGGGLIAEALDEDITSMHSADLHDLYADIVSSKSTQSSQLTVGAHLLRFHDFIVRRYGAPHVDFSDLAERRHPTEIGVDANLITPSHFDRALDLLQWQKPDLPRLRTMQIVAAILGYRCGLRSQEVERLMLVHVHGDETPELLVRNSIYAYVKSSDSVRRIPLAVLLTQDELDFFRKWVHLRRTEAAGRTDVLLFCAAGQQTTPLQYHRFFPTVMEAIHRVTGDSSLTFHHLRHSCCTFLLIRLIWNSPLPPRHLPPFLQHRLFSDDEREYLKRNLLHNARLGRQSLFMVSQILGHASPETTLLHYSHLCDWLLAAELSRPEVQPILSRQVLRRLTGITDVSLYALTGRVWSALPVLSLALRRSPQESIDPLIKQSNAPIWKKIPDVQVEDSTELPSWRKVASALNVMRTCPDEKVADLSLRFAVSEEELRDWDRAAFEIFVRRTRNKERRHVVKKYAPADGSFALTKPVQHPKDIRILERIYSTVGTLTERELAASLDGALYFARHYSVKAGEIRFISPEMAHYFLKFMELIGVEAQMIYLVHFPTKGASDPSAALQREYWCNKTGIPLERCVSVAESNAGHIPQGTIGIRVSPDGIVTRKLKTKKKSATETTSNRQKKIPCKTILTPISSYGFRYALYLVLVVFSRKAVTPIPGTLQLIATL